MMVRLAVVFLSLLGIALSARFTQAYYSREAGAARRSGLPISSCTNVVEAPQAAMFGAPNSVLGLVVYVALIIWALWPASTSVWWQAITLGLTVAMWAAVALGIYLTYALIVVLQVSCRLCLTSHALNLLLAMLLTFMR